MEEFSSVMKPCIKKSFFGSVLSAGTTLVAGQFALIPVTAKFITNFSFCLKDHYTEKIWDEAKEKLYQYEIPNTNINSFRDKLLSINYKRVLTNRNDVLEGLLNSSIEILKESVDDWASDNFQEVISNCLKQTSEIFITRDDYSLLDEKLKSQQHNLINNILGESFINAASNYLPKISQLVDYSLSIESAIQKFRETEESHGGRFQRLKQPIQIINQISMLPNGIMAAQAVKLLYQNVGKTITYEQLAKKLCISYEYSNDLLNRLDSYVVGINKRTLPHKINIYTGYNETTFYDRAFKGLSKY